LENAAAQADLKQKTRSNARLLRAENDTLVNRDYSGDRIKLKLLPPSSVPLTVVVWVSPLPPV
jgi:hypothetical protein